MRYTLFLNQINGVYSIFDHNEREWIIWNDCFVDYQHNSDSKLITILFGDIT